MQKLMCETHTKIISESWHAWERGVVGGGGGGGGDKPQCYPDL